MKIIIIAVYLFFYAAQLSAAIERNQLYSIFDVAQELYAPNLQDNERMTFNPGRHWWDFDVWKAAYNTYELDGIKHHNIYLFGGLAQTNFMSIELATLMICHELGHGFAGAPLKVNGNAVEGQADYYATGQCMRNIFDALPISNEQLDSILLTLPQQVLNWCNTAQDIEYCYRGLYSIAGQMEFFRQHDYIQVDTSWFTPDSAVVSEIDHGLDYYPTPQCRIDTYLASLLDNERPKCWFHP